MRASTSHLNIWRTVPMVSRYLKLEKKKKTHRKTLKSPFCLPSRCHRRGSIAIPIRREMCHTTFVRTAEAIFRTLSATCHCRSASHSIVSIIGLFASRWVFCTFAIRSIVLWLLKIVWCMQTHDHDVTSSLPSFMIISGERRPRRCRHTLPFENKHGNGSRVSVKMLNHILNWHLVNHFGNDVYGFDFWTADSSDVTLFVQFVDVSCFNCVMNG